MNVVNNSCDVIYLLGIVFGMSGVCGFVKDFIFQVCVVFMVLFVVVMQEYFFFDIVVLVIDNCLSSYGMVQVCVVVLVDKGVNCIFYGVVLILVLVFQFMFDNMFVIMVMGSYILFEWNGFKFYCFDGEIMKYDEVVIFSVEDMCSYLEFKEFIVLEMVVVNYIFCYIFLFFILFLKNKCIGIYEYLSVGCDFYKFLFIVLGVEVISLGRSDNFVFIDIEVVSKEDWEKVCLWVKEFDLDVIFLIDGDGDCFFIVDEVGQWLRGDILGLLCLFVLGVEVVVIFVSCNSIIFFGCFFKYVKFMKIGLFYVIEVFNELFWSYSCIVGFEVNGGFLLGSDICINEQNFYVLLICDVVLLVIMLFYKSRNISISVLVNEFLICYIYFDRLQGIMIDKS